MASETTPETTAETLTIGEWRADLKTGRLTSARETRAVEPKVMDLLFLLASRPGEVFSRDEIMEALWPGVTVGEDTLARSISKLRKALGDDPAAPRYLETIPKRGYRLIAAPGGAAAPEQIERRPPQRTWLWLALAAAVITALAILVAEPLIPSPKASAAAAAELTSRGDDAYFQYTRADNEAAIDLYQRALAADPDHARALAGLANATVQTVVRWPQAAGRSEIVDPNLGEALAKGRTRTPQARQALARAMELAERSVRLAPSDAASHKALGFVRSAQGDFGGALAAYRRALELDPDAWGVMINMGDVLEIKGDKTAALPWFERAYAAMSRVYHREAVRVWPWQPDLGAAIALRHAELGRAQEAELWYRRVLSKSPLHRDATAGLAKVLAGRDPAAARQLCREMAERIGPSEGCAEYL